MIEQSLSIWYTHIICLKLYIVQTAKGLKN